MILFSNFEPENANIDLLKNPTIYIIDQNPAQGNFLKYGIRTSGIRNIVHFSSPAECLEVHSRDRNPAYILADCDLKNTSDLEFAAQVSQSYPELRVLLYSEEDDPAHAEKLFSLGITDFILKSPGNLNWIKELISNLQYLIKEKRPVERDLF